MADSGRVTAVSRSQAHTFTKPNHEKVRLVTGLGVEGDALGMPSRSQPDTFLRALR